MSDTAEKLAERLERSREALGWVFPGQFAELVENLCAAISYLKAECGAGTPAELQERDYWEETIKNEAGRFGFDTRGLAGAALIRELAEAEATAVESERARCAADICPGCREVDAAFDPEPTRAESGRWIHKARSGSDVAVHCYAGKIHTRGVGREDG